MQKSWIDMIWKTNSSKEQLLYVGSEFLTKIFDVKLKEEQTASVQTWWIAARKMKQKKIVIETKMCKGRKARKLQKLHERVFSAGIISGSQIKIILDAELYLPCLSVQVWSAELEYMNCFLPLSQSLWKQFHCS